MSPPWNDPEHPDGELESIARLYREHGPREPSWEATRARIETRLDEALPPTRRWRLGYLTGILATAAAALFAGVLLARGLWTDAVVAQDEPEVVAHQSIPIPTAEDEEPYAVALLSEVNIIRMHPDDADRVVMSQPLMGSFEMASPDDIIIEPDPEEGWVPRLRRGTGVPMVIVARATDEDDDP